MKKMLFLLLILNIKATYAQDIHTITAYSHGCTMDNSNPSGRRQRAANNKWPVNNMTVAADWKLYPPNTEIIIEGIGVWTVYDRSKSKKDGGRIYGKRIDLFVSNCKFAKEWGRRKLKVWKIPKKSTTWSTYNK